MNDHQLFRKNNYTESDLNLAVSRTRYKLTNYEANNHLYTTDNVFLYTNV